MTKAKAILIILKKCSLIKILLTIIILTLMMLSILSSLNRVGQSSTSLASAAENEYKFWQGIGLNGYSCQGEKYCKHFKSG
ncbi:MAG: hypothetical protein IJ725_01250, partial [Ruminococcus sp.]|nr:hypothetical protein [Ruminococcus sp.]